MWILNFLKTNVNARRQNKFRKNKENHDWKEDYITIPKKPRLEKSEGRKQKDKLIITKYPNMNLFMQEAKLVCDKIGIPEGNPIKTTRPG